jgi:hypothetical protein
MIATPASLRSDFIHIVGMAIHIAPERTNHITGIGTEIARTPGEVLYAIEDYRGDQKERRDTNAEYFDVLSKALRLPLPLVLR